MTFIIAGGGTGGHVFPGLAIATELRSQGEAPRIAFVGTERGLERQIVPEAGFSIYLVNTGRLKGGGWRSRLLTMARMPFAFVRSLRILVSFGPHVVIGVGGYVSWPLCAMAWLLRIPLVIQEQNSVPGMANRLLGRLARKVFIAFPEAETYFPSGRCELVGNPIRKEISAIRPLTKITADEPLTILIFGGSQGASRLNCAVAEALPQLADLSSRIRLILQTGGKDHDLLNRAYAASSIDIEPHDFITSMAAAYEKAHLVICRGGAGILELTLVGRPAIIVPYPFAADDHQTYNAKVFEEAGAALVVSDQLFDGDRCATLIRQFESDRQRLLAMAQAAKRLALPDAAKKIAASCVALARDFGGLGRSADA